MNDKVIEALKKISADETLVTKLGACETIEEAYALASTEGEGFTLEEFASTMDQLKAASEKSAELSDEDLRKTAGGMDDWEITAAISAGGGVVSATVALFAI